MPGPANQTAGTAIDLGAFPATLTQNVRDTGVNFDVWYKFTVPVGKTFVGISGFGTYQVDILPFEDDGVTPVLNIDAFNSRCQFPVTPGNTYRVQFFSNSNTAPGDLHIRASYAALSAIQVGDILVNDDNTNTSFLFPIIAIDPNNNYTIRQVIPNIANGEAGDILQDAPIRILLEDAARATPAFVLYDKDFATIATIAQINNSPRSARGNQTLGKFYIGASNAGGGAGVAKFRSVARDGTLGAIVSLPATGMNVLCPNNDETILYYSGVTSEVAQARIKRFNIPGAVALSDLVVGSAGYKYTDILVLPNGSILALSFNSGTFDTNVFRYSAAGALLNTYAFGVNFTSSTLPRLAYALDGSNSFWIMTHPSATPGTSKFQNIKCSDGSILKTVLSAEYSSGAWTASETDTPPGDFGTSPSCPFFLMAGAAPPVTNAGPDQNINGWTFPICTALAASATGTGPFTYVWTVISGPGTPVFNDATSPTSQVCFDTLGVYVLQVCATNAGGTTCDQVTITVSIRPVLTLGPDDYAIISQGYDLKGVINGGAWVKVNGPGDVTFVDATNPLTHVDFSADGKYDLNYVVQHGIYADRQQCIITVLDAPVMPHNLPPV